MIKGAALRSVSVALFATGLVAASAPSRGEPAVPQAAAQILAIEKEMEALYNSPEFPRNPGIVHKYFAPEMSLIDIMEPGRFQGADFLKHADEVGQTFLGKVEFKNINVQATDEMAYVDYIQYLVGKDLNGNEYEMNLYCTDIFRRIDGKWLMVHQHVTLPMDQATLVKVMSPKGDKPR